MYKAKGIFYFGFIKGEAFGSTGVMNGVDQLSMRRKVLGGRRVLLWHII